MNVISRQYRQLIKFNKHSWEYSYKQSESCLDLTPIHIPTFSSGLLQLTYLNTTQKKKKKTRDKHFHALDQWQWTLSYISVGIKVDMYQMAVYLRISAMAAHWQPRQGPRNSSRRWVWIHHSCKGQMSHLAVSIRWNQSRQIWRSAMECS